MNTVSFPNVKLLPKYEVLYNDLESLGFKTYLGSRTFKVFMSTKGYYEKWCEHKQKATAARTIFSIDVNMDSLDTDKTFIMHLNSCALNVTQKVVTEIIENFIEKSKNKRDFSILIDGLQISKFDKVNISKIESAVNLSAKNTEQNIKPRIIKKEESFDTTSKIFIVHGHDEAALSNLKLFLGTQKLSSTVLSEQVNEGQTVIEKFEKHSNASFAIVLLTGDDFGNVKGATKKKKRARQNVIFELGYFIAKLERKNVIVLYEEGVELPSDLAGIVRISLSDNAGWKLKAVKELKNAGFTVDANSIV